MNSGQHVLKRRLLHVRLIHCNSIVTVFCFSWCYNIRPNFRLFHYHDHSSYKFSLVCITALWRHASSNMKAVFQKNVTIKTFCLSSVKTAHQTAQVHPLFHFQFCQLFGEISIKTLHVLVERWPLLSNVLTCGSLTAEADVWNRPDTIHNLW